MPEEKENYIYRILDANFNRAREGLRVVEEIARFVLEDAGLVSQLKEARHNLGQVIENLPLPLLKARDSRADVGASIILCSEDKRKDCHSVLCANFRRTEEALRVLEEFVKLLSPETAIEFKKLRFRVYGLEKEAEEKLE